LCDIQSLVEGGVNSMIDLAALSYNDIRDYRFDRGVADKLNREVSGFVRVPSPCGSQPVALGDNSTS
jgi:hypothetical protein